MTVQIAKVVLLYMSLGMTLGLIIFLLFSAWKWYSERRPTGSTTGTPLRTRRGKFQARKRLLLMKLKKLWAKTRSWSARPTMKQEALLRMYRMALSRKLRTIDNKFRIKTRFKLARRKLNRHPVATQLNNNKWLVAAFFVASYWFGTKLRQGWNKANDLLVSPPSFLTWTTGAWVLGSLIALTLIIWTIRYAWSRRTTGSTSKSESTPVGPYIWGAIKLALALVLIVTLWRLIPAWAGADRAGHRRPQVVVVEQCKEYYETKTVMVTPGSPLIVEVDPRYTFEAWHDENLTDRNVERKGTTLVTTISASGEFSSEVTFALFPCAPPNP